MKKLLSISIALYLFCSNPNDVNGQWQLTGNSATSSSILGTTNNVSLRMYSNNLQRMIIDSLGRVGIGISFPKQLLSVQSSGTVPAANWISSGAPVFAGFGEGTPGNADFNLLMASSVGANARGVLGMKRSRGTLANPTAVALNDQLGSLLVSGYEGTNFQGSAAVDFFVDGAPSVGNVPARISFVTGSNGGNRAERFRIGSTGDIAANGSQFTITQANGNVGIGSGNLNVVTGNLNMGSGNINVNVGNINMGSGNKTIQFGTPEVGGTGMMTMFPTGTQNGDRMVIQHSPAFPTWGLQYMDSSDRFHFLGDGISAMTVDLNSRRVGIGTRTPGSALEVAGQITITGGVPGAGKVLTSDATGLASWTTPGATPWSVSGNNIFNSNTGNVGIGTSTPTARLDVKTTSSFQTAKLNGGNSMYLGLYENDLYRGYIGSFAGAAADVDFGTGGSNTGGKVHLTTKAIPRLTIDSIGQVGIGVTSPTAQIDVFNNTPNRSLNIISSAANGQIANISTTVALNSANDLLQLDLPTGQVASAQFIEASLGGTATKFAVNADGSVGVGGSALTGVGLNVQLGTDAAPASGGYIVSGPISGLNIVMDNNEIMARNNGATSRLFLQNSGGDLSMCVPSGAVSIGTNTIATGYKLNVNGKIIGTEVRVEALANWPDYVFGPNHKLLPLEDLEASINAYKHLPGIPSAAEVKENGIMLGAMQTKTMEKVEENTLYILQLNNRIKELEQQNKKIKELEEKIEQLSKLIK